MEILPPIRTILQSYSISSLLTYGLECRQDEKGGNDSEKHFTQNGIPKPDSIANLSQEELDAMEKARGDYRAAADLLGIHVNSLHRLIRNLGLKSQLTSSPPSRV